jgi:hypothetical protein
MERGGFNHPACAGERGTETNMTIPLEALQSTPPAGHKAVTRRGLIEIAGVTLVGTAFLSTAGCAAALGEAPSFPHVDTGPVAPETVGGVNIGTLGGGTKPIYVTRPGSMDPVEHSVADTLFWGDIMMEHAMFFVMLMPGPENARPRGEAEQFQRRFADHLTQLRRGRLTRGELAGFNRSTVALARTFADYKTSMQEAQESGRYRTLVWPSFFDHTRKEAERFIRRIDQVSRGDVSYSRAEVVPFWADKMEEHSLFIAQLLDPDEQALIKAADTASETFAKLEANPGRGGGATDPAMKAAESIIDFKTAAEKGIRTSQIQSIIHPALADHVRREAVRFKDELERAV